MGEGVRPPAKYKCIDPLYVFYVWLKDDKFSVIHFNDKASPKIVVIAKADMAARIDGSNTTTNFEVACNCMYERV